MKFFKINTSMLYPVSPKEIGTGMCESLSSYIIRLSTEHNIITGVLINKIMAPILDNRYILNSSINGRNRFYDGAKSLNSFDKSASEFTRILGSLTGRNDIKETTLREIKDLIASRDLLKNSLAWCPLCLNRWKEEAYYPLIWFFKDVNICVQHNCGLEDICPSCNKHLPILHRKMLIGYCPYCSNWLGTSEIKRIENDKELFKAQEISNLVANRSFLARGNDKESISNALLQLINCYTNGNLAEFARLINVPKVTLWIGFMGGDDFMQKPFYTDVLVAKIQALMRRTYSYTQTETNVVEYEGVVLNLQSGEVTYHNQILELTKNEFKILQILMQNIGSIVSRDNIMRKLWENESFVDDNTLTVNVARVRKKLAELGKEEFIHTKKGQGYIIT